MCKQSRSVHPYPHLNASLRWQAGPNSYKILLPSDALYELLWLKHTLPVMWQRWANQLTVISQSLCKWATTPSLNFAGQLMHHSSHMLSQVALIFLHLAANLWPRSPPTGQIFSENCKLTKGFSHVRVSPRLSEPRFAMLPACYYSERETAFSIYLLHPRLHLHVVFLTLSLQAVLPLVSEEGHAHFWGEAALFLVLIYLFLLCPLSPELDL